MSVAKQYAMANWQLGYKHKGKRYGDHLCVSFCLSDVWVCLCRTSCTCTCACPTMLKHLG